MCRVRHILDSLLWPRKATVLSVDVRGRLAYFVYLDGVIYLLDDYRDLFSTDAVRHWINTLTGEVVPSWRGFKLTLALERAILFGTVKDAQSLTEPNRG